MTLSFVLFLVLGVAGAYLQRTSVGERLRNDLWTAYFNVLLPLAGLYTVLRVDVDANLVRALASALVAGWIVWLISFGAAGLLASDGASRGALGLSGAVGNTGFVGIPLAFLVFGRDGLADAILYDQLWVVVPMIVLTTAVARRMGRDGEQSERRQVWRQVALSPPLWGALSGVALRVLWVGQVDLHALSLFLGVVMSVAGFLLLGLSIPLERLSHSAGEVGQVSTAIAVKMAAAPLVLLAVATVAGADLPRVFFFMAAMPTAFHVLVLARICDMRADLVRLALVVSTALMLGASLVAVVLR